jgi:septum site-determining protein MinD
MRIADELLVVASPDFPALGTVAKTIEIAKQLNTPVSGIILNRVKGKGYELKKHDVEGCMELPVLSIIPDDEKINESIAARMPVVLYNPKSPSSKAFRKLSASILGEDVLESPGLWDRIRNIFRDMQP